MQITQGLRRCQFLFPSRTATIFGERKTSWGEFGDRVSKLSKAFVANGVRRGDRIAILAQNSDRYAELYYAIAWAGAVAVPFNTRWAKAEFEFALEDSQPVLLLADRQFADQARALAAFGPKLIGIDAGVGDCNIEQLIEANDPQPDASGSGDDLAGIFYTGGTTGRAKGVMLSHANLCANFFLRQSVAPYETGAIYLHTPPMFHLADANSIFGLTSLGATHVILPGFDPIATIRAIETHKVTALVLVPTMIGMLCEALQTNPGDMSSMRRLTYGASPISGSLLKTAMAALPNAIFVQAYGQTELSPAVTVLDHADHLAGRLRSAGRPMPGIDLRIVDADLRDVAQGEVGEIVARGPGVMLGYWRQPELTQQTIVDGWLRTGDAGYFDSEGYLYLVDRIKDMIVSGAENVYSAEVEQALSTHPNVLQCAVIGVPDQQWGERVHAIVYVRPGTTLSSAELTDHCAPLIANYKRPKSYDFWDTPLPLSAAGKILKTDLRLPYWKDKARSIG